MRQALTADLWRQTIMRWCFSVLSAAFTCSAVAVAPNDGFFYGIDMEPVGTASIATVETEPAVALVFAVDQATAEITRQFDQWYAGSPLPGVEVYAIAVEPADISREVILEAINQRKLQMPVFLVRNDMLLGDDYRLLVLNNDAEVERFTSLDFAGVNAALQSIGADAPAPAATPDPADAPVTEPADPADPEVVVETDSGVLPDGSTYTRITTTTRTREERTRGGTGEDSVYVNTRFGFTVTFPPEWQYQVAAKEDGAVAIPPRGSQTDMRVWALPAGPVQTPQQYIDETLEALAQRLKTRVNVDRRFNVSDNGEPGIDITYNYTKPFESENPAKGGLLYRGRMQVFVDEGYVKAVSVDAPSGEFNSARAVIESFFLSFQIRPEDIPTPAEYDSPAI